MDLTLAIAAGGLALGVVNSAVQVQGYRKDRSQLTVSAEIIKASIGTSPDPSKAEPYVLITATNTGRYSIYVDGTGFDTSRSRSAPSSTSFIPLREDVPPCATPVLLQVGQATKMWIRQEELTKALGDRHPVRAVVYGPGRQRWTSSKLGDVGRLGQPVA